MPNTYSEEQHNTLVAAAVAAEKASGAAALTAEKERADRAEAALAALTSDNEKAQIAAIITAAEAKGQIVPANKPKVQAFADTVLKSVAKGDERKALIASFKEFVEAMPAKVSLGEKGKSESKAETGSERASDKVDAEAKKLMSADTTGKLSYADAVSKVFAANPDLKTAYAEEM